MRTHAYTHVFIYKTSEDVEMLLESVFKAFLGRFGNLICIYTIENKTLEIKPLEKVL